MIMKLEKRIMSPQPIFIDPDYEAWMREVDAAFLQEAYVTSDELPDQPYHSYYIDGYSAVETAVTVLDEEGYYDDDFTQGDLIYDET